MIKTHRFERAEVASFQQSKLGKSHNGDMYFCTETDEYFLFAVCDGLGSGFLAYEASKIVVNHIQENHSDEPEQLMIKCNHLLQNSRGVVLSIVKINFLAKEISYITHGNINGAFCFSDRTVERMIGRRGFLCGRQVKLKTEIVPLKSDVQFFIFTDGISLEVKVSDFCRKNQSSSQLLASILQRSQVKKDDITLLAGTVTLP